MHHWHQNFFFCLTTSPKKLGTFVPGEGATTQGDLAEKESTTAWCSTECGESQRIFFSQGKHCGGGNICG